METPRIIPPNEISDIATMILAIMSIPKQLSANAVAVFPGMGEEDRVEQGIRLWKLMILRDTSPAHFLLIAGINDKERTFKEIDLQNLEKTYGISKLEYPLKNISIIVRTKNTLEQAEWLRDKVLELKIKDITLCTSYYHMTRAYLTVLKTFIKASMRIPIFPCPTATAPETISPEMDRPQIDLVPSETERILKYQKTNDVATKKELEEYIAWLWKIYKYQFIFSL